MHQEINTKIKQGMGDKKSSVPVLFERIYKEILTRSIGLQMRASGFGTSPNPYSAKIKGNICFLACLVIAKRITDIYGGFQIICVCKFTDIGALSRPVISITKMTFENNFSRPDV